MTAAISPLPCHLEHPKGTRSLRYLFQGAPQGHFFQGASQGHFFQGAKREIFSENNNRTFNFCLFTLKGHPVLFTSSSYPLQVKKDRFYWLVYGLYF